MDFVVIIRVRQRFGSSDDEDSMEQGAPFVGKSKDYEFACPHVYASSEATLLFQAHHVIHPRNILSINGVDIAGGVPVSGFFVATVGEPQQISIHGIWSAQNLIVPPNTLRDQGNILHVEARTDDGATNGDMPNFIVDNVVLFFRTRPSRPQLGAEVVERV